LGGIFFILGWLFLLLAAMDKEIKTDRNVGLFAWMNLALNNEHRRDLRGLRELCVPIFKEHNERKEPQSTQRKSKVPMRLSINSKT
jgi:hypothetical protein